MSINRYDAKRDDTEPGIIRDLEKRGYFVWRRLPVDLLVWHPVFGFDCIEAKSAGKPLKPKDGPQKEFVELTKCPIINSADQYKP